MNHLLISPNFPAYHANYADRLNKLGINVLAVGDAPYENLDEYLKAALTEYYKVDSLENYDSVLKAVGYFTWKYGKIHGVDSINEYWLETDARLRTDFNMDGVKYPQVLESKAKSHMKKYFAKAGIKTARWILATDLPSAARFAQECGYPLVAKPDIGVGAANTFPIRNDNELKEFFAQDRNGFIIEEFISGAIITFDGLVDGNGNLVFSSSHRFGRTFMDVVLDDDDLSFYSERITDEDLSNAGKALISAYGIRSQFFHFEFFRCDAPRGTHLKAGDLVGLEVNMRTPGGHMIDMINYAYDFDAYSLWADVIAGRNIAPVGERKYFTAYASRKYRYNYAKSDEEVRELLGDALCLEESVEKALSRVMGDKIFLFRAKTLDEIGKMREIVQQKL